MIPLFIAASAIALSSQGAQRPPTFDPTYGLPVPNLPHEEPNRGPDSDWIWADKTSDNQQVCLRKDFTLESAPSKAMVYITADNTFKISVNGQSVGERGYDKSDDLAWNRADHFDVAKLLHAGANCIAILGGNQGGPAGVAARLEIDGKPAVLTDKSWRVVDAPGPDNWQSPAFSDAAWPHASPEAHVGGGTWGNINGWPGMNGSAPWLAHMEVTGAAGFTSRLDGAFGSGALMDGHRNWIQVKVTPAADGSSYALIDFGRESTGRIIVNAKTDVLVDVGTGESEDEAMKSPWGGFHRLKIAAGDSDSTPYSAFRYVKLVFPATSDNAPEEIESVVLDFDYYPVEYKGSFDCSDPLLTKIWYLGAYTAHLCMQQSIWDAPKRDRAEWMGDLHVSGEVINNVFADKFLMEKTMQSLRDQAQGPNLGAAVSKGHVNGIPGYSAAWICGMADFYRHIGDKAFLDRNHDLLLSLIAYMKGDLNSKGAFANLHGAWPFVDWSHGFDGDTPLARGATQFFYVKAAAEAVFMLHAMGDDANAQKVEAWRRQLIQSGQEAFLNGLTLTFSDRRQENAMAVYSGETTEDENKAIWDKVLNPDSPSWNQDATPYYNNYVIFAMSMLGQTKDALDFVRKYWGGMLAEGATSTWEGYDLSWPKEHFHEHLQADDGTGTFVSLAHGWSAGATSFLTERVLGVRPTSGGFRTLVIAPDLCDLTWAQGDVPTPNGILHVRAERSGGHVQVTFDLPQGETATVGSGPGAQQVSGAGHHRVRID